ncbi:hypothetical protein BDV30DRAFT_153129 [Aspergillus minisclerotigenes]|uniref:Uncharacterized protein n=1 Tax=Aspergillus minisclerotigenes TaxID=656917 RepID=A0A5N6IX67_9EURO|nr:hypothetical protein BDV30DRAFT_153129 [Aspergillus minisclerotigenes]
MDLLEGIYFETINDPDNIEMKDRWSYLCFVSSFYVTAQPVLVTMPIHCRSVPLVCDGLSSTAFYHHIRITSLDCFLRLATTSLPNSGDTRCPQHSFFGLIVISRCFMDACTLLSWRNNLCCLKSNIRKSLIANHCFAVLAWLGLPLLPWVLN